MFEGLFEDNMDSHSGKEQESGKSGHAGKKAAEAICLPRSFGDEGCTGLAGITNQGATCYLNSLIQTLLFTPELKDAVFRLRESELGKRGEKGSRSIPLELQMLFANMLLVDKSAVSTTSLTDSFGWNSREEFSQHDVQELNRILFSALEQSLEGLTGSDMVNELYRGKIVNQILCKECGNVSEREEHFLDLTVAVAGYSDLFDSLTDAYLNTETLADKNQYKCGKCDKLVDAEKGTKLRDLPPILTFCLLRLTFDFHKMERQKEISKFVFPQEISMGSFMDAVPSKCSDYELFSVVIHRGGAHGGHYHAIIKDNDELGHWTKPHYKPQTSVKLQSKKQKDDYLEFETPVDLINHILSSESDWVTMDQLSHRIQQETGVSWNKRFKKRHGTLAKFLGNHTECFTFDESTKNVISKSALISSEATGSSAANDDVEKEVESKEELADGDGYWFAFDDRRVRAAHKMDIERYYGGKECAYMLYYRQKSLCRPPVAKGNARYLVPEHIITTIEEINSNLSSQREADDLRLNTVNLKVYLPTQYTFSDQFITAKTDHKYEELEFDQRKTATDLLVAIHSQLPGEEFSANDLQLYVVKRTHNVLHLIENLSGENAECDTKIAALGLFGGKGVLLVSKTVIDKHQVLCGDEHEPYQITLYHNDTSQTVMLPKSSSMQELPVHVVKCMQLEPPIYLYLLKDGSKSQVELPTHENHSISQHLTNESHLIVSHSAIDETSSSKLNLFVQVNVQDVDVKYSMTVLLRDTISTFVEMIVAKLLEDNQISNTINVRLRLLENNTPGIPLFYDRTVKDCRLSNGNVLLVEEGEPVKSSHMVLYYTLPNADVHSIVCVCTQIIHKCITQMVANSDPVTNIGSKYYLMTLDWMGELHDIVYNTNQTLAKARIKHGDTLALLEGLPPPKDAITVSVHQYSGDNGEGYSQSYMQWLVNSVESMSLQETELKENKINRTWSITIGSDATIEELKTRLLSLGDISVETIHHLRLRAVNGRNPGLIYKCTAKSLRTYKIRGPNMMVEVLANSESLREDELLLTLRQKSLTNDDYGVGETFLWDTSRGSTAQQLRSAVALQVGCEPNSLHIARYEPERFEWRLITGSASARSGRKGGKRTKLLESSLRKAPYFLQDGDLIGYIITSSAANQQEVTVKTFQTDADQGFKNMCLDKKREQRRLKADQDNWISISENESTTEKRRTEKAITIKVGEFTKG